MFTGIVEEVGTIKKIGNGFLVIQGNKILSGTQLGDSIAVNGVCLTVVKIEKNEFTVDVMNETLNRSNLAMLSCSSHVNLERAMSAEGRFGGHFVSGHIDGTGRISKIQKDGNAIWFYIECDSSILNLIIEKGSVAIDGISLTVAKVSESDFAVSVIPHTAQNTILLEKKSGDSVNLENDLIGKYVQKLLNISSNEKKDFALEQKLSLWLKDES